MRIENKNRLQQNRRWRVRNKISGTAQRPRLSVKFTNMHIYAQFVNDEKGITLAAVSTRGKGLPDRDKLRANAVTAKKVGGWAAEAAKAQGIERVVFDRGSAQYHGKVKALADAARAAGLKF